MNSRWPLSAAAFVMLALGIAGCQSDQEYLTIKTTSGHHRFTIEIAETPEERAEGLMYRQSLAKNHGMLFDFQEDKPVGFWMKNTFISLDMIFIGGDGIVMHVEEHVPPHSEDIVSPPHPVRFVLELVAGSSHKIDLKPGDQIHHPSITNSAKN